MCCVFFTCNWPVRTRNFTPNRESGHGWLKYHALFYFQLCYCSITARCIINTGYDSKWAWRMIPKPWSLANGVVGVVQCHDGHCCHSLHQQDEIQFHGEGTRGQYRNKLTHWLTEAVAWTNVRMESNLRSISSNSFLRKRTNVIRLSGKPVNLRPFKRTWFVPLPMCDRSQGVYFPPNTASGVYFFGFYSNKQTNKQTNKQAQRDILSIFVFP